MNNIDLYEYDLHQYLDDFINISNQQFPIPENQIIYLMIYQTKANDYQYPFLSYMLQLEDNRYRFPIIPTYMYSSETKNQIFINNIKKYIIQTICNYHNDIEKYLNLLNIIGLYKKQKQWILVIDITELKLKISNFYDEYIFVIIYEIVHYQSVWNNWCIDNFVVTFFINNPSICYLISKKTKKILETPEIWYYYEKNINHLNFCLQFGPSYSTMYEDKKYWITFVNNINKENSSFMEGWIRFIIFTGVCDYEIDETYMYEKNPEWIQRNSDSCRNINGKLCIRKHDQQYPLSSYPNI